MYRNLLLFSLFLFWMVSSIAQQFKVSDEAELSIMTLGPTQTELYSAFGHSAIHLFDPATGVDVVYNYGVFDFDQENFYWNFARGKMLYQLGLSKGKSFIYHYKKANRYIIEQRLNLTTQEKQRVVDFLSNNYKPENREYYYNYVYDNCATKMRDVLDEALPGRITFSYDYVQEGKTIRDLMDDYLAYQPWGDWIIDIGLGLQIDKEATADEYMFLPDYIQHSFEKATLKTDSATIPLIAETVTVFTPEPQTYENGVYTPFNVFAIFFFVIGFLTNRDFKRQKRTKWIDPVVFTLPGIIGWWVVFLWFGTEHLSQNNLNILWAIPLHIPFAYLINVKKMHKFLSQYFVVVSIWYVVLIIVWSFLPQPLHIALIPLILTMILRGFYVHFDLRKQIKKANRQA